MSDSGGPLPRTPGHSPRDGPALEGCEDAELVRLHTDGHPEAFGEIFRRHRDRMWAVAVRTCGDPELAADAVQDAFLSAMRRSASYRGDAAVTSWLHRIVVNACIDRIRRERPADELDDEAPSPVDAHSAVDTRLDVHDALGRLPESQRLALVLVDMHGYAVAEAASILGVAEGTVKSRCARGRSSLAQLLGPADTPGHGDDRPLAGEPQGAP